MPTTKQRINITPDRDTQYALKQLAKRDKMPVSAKTLQLLRTALEWEEDAVLAEIAERRMKTKGRTYSHEEAWKIK